ncbi:MAG: hypothetical protein WDN30_12980 [Pararobbsia sp.]
MAGALLGEFYRHAIDAARLQLDSDRRALQVSRDESEEALRRATAERDLALEAAREARDALTAALADKRALELRLDFEHDALAASRTDTDSLHAVLERDNAALRAELGRLRADQQAAQAELLALRAKLQENAEIYAAQIKDAVADAERRVKPLLLELDTLRGMASTYESGSRIWPDVNTTSSAVERREGAHRYAGSPLEPPGRRHRRAASRTRVGRSAEWPSPGGRVFYWHRWLRAIA